MRTLLLFGLLVSLLGACSRQGADDAPQPSMESQVMGGASPDGQRHPGQIVHEDQVSGRTWKTPATEVPQPIAWVEMDGKWIPVLKIVVTGSGDRREITKFGPQGETLERTLMTLPPGDRSRAPGKKSAAP